MGATSSASLSGGINHEIDLCYILPIPLVYFHRTKTLSGHLEVERG